MAGWTNIFDLSPCDVYVRYVGITASPNPSSVTHFVRAEDLDPAVGTVTVMEGGLIVATFQNPSGNGGPQPEIVVMPQDPLTGPVQLTVSDADGLSTETSSFREIASVTSAGAGIYSVQEADPPNVADYADQFEWGFARPLPGDLASGHGVMFQNIGQAL